MTNYERIKAMTPEEMAIMFFYTDCQRICAVVVANINTVFAVTAQIQKCA